jgi:1,4-alpha-glucan branching enzyme
MTTKNAAKIERPRRKRVTFRFEAGRESDVRLAGTFNNWDAEAQPLTRKNGNGTYSATLLLPPGRYEYKFIVNGEWQCDSACPNWVPNEHGTLNSVVEVR